MVGAPIVEWSYFVYAVNRLLVDTADSHQIQTIINASFLPVLEGAEMQLQLASNFIIKHQIMRHALEYCYRLGGYVKGLNNLEYNALINILKLLWDSSWE